MVPFWSFLLSVQQGVYLTPFPAFLRMNMSFLFVPCFDHFQSDHGKGSAYNQTSVGVGRPRKKKIRLPEREEQGTHAGMP